MSYRKFIRDLEAEVNAAGYDLCFFSARSRELRVRAFGSNTMELYAMRRLGEGTNNDFRETWPPGFEFCGSL